MRDEFRAELHVVSQLLVAMAEACRAAMRDATGPADRRPGAAEAVIVGDAEIDSRYRQVEERV